MYGRHPWNRSNLFGSQVFSSNDSVSSVSHSVVSDSLWPHGLQSARLFCLRDFPGKNPEWVAISSSRGSSQPRDKTQVSGIADRFFTIWATREAIWYLERRKFYLWITELKTTLRRPKRTNWFCFILFVNTALSLVGWAWMGRWGYIEILGSIILLENPRREKQT